MLNVSQLPVFPQKLNKNDTSDNWKFISLFILPFNSKLRIDQELYIHWRLPCKHKEKLELNWWNSDAVTDGRMVAATLRDN